MSAVSDEIRFDRFGRMLYHPEFHPNHGKAYSESDLEYLCRYWEVDGAERMSFALGRPEHSLATQVNKLKRLGKFDYYKNLNRHW